MMMAKGGRGDVDRSECEFGQWSAAAFLHSRECGLRLPLLDYNSKLMIPYIGSAHVC